MDGRGRQDEARTAVEDWCTGRAWAPRAPLVLWLAWIGAHHVLDSDYTSLFGALDLGIHEAGHLLFGVFGGDFLTVAGGTLLQCAAPILAALMFVRQPDYFAAAFCGGWLSMNLYNVATYMADARELDLPLVTVGGGDSEVGHDWNYMLAALHLLDFDTTLAAFLRLLAFSLMWGAVATQGWMLWRMARARG
jgi:hypothetical protein